MNTVILYKTIVDWANTWSVDPNINTWTHARRYLHIQAVEYFEANKNFYEGRQFTEFEKFIKDIEIARTPQEFIAQIQLNLLKKYVYEFFISIFV